MGCDSALQRPFDSEPRAAEETRAKVPSRAKRRQRLSVGWPKPATERKRLVAHNGMLRSSLRAIEAEVLHEIAVRGAEGTSEALVAPDWPDWSH
jgi:hypothetical protein